MNEALWRLDGRKALVTGGSSGIGKAVAEHLLERGAEVVIVARQGERLEKAVATWRLQGFIVSALQADISSVEGRDYVVQTLEEHGGGLDVLVNNVGGDVRKSFQEYRTEDYQKVFDLNVVSAAEMCRLCYEMLASGNPGCVVNNASVAGQTYVSTSALYAITKATVLHLTRYLAVAWASAGVRVNAVAPWLVETDLTRRALAEADFRAHVADRTPLGRIAEVHEVAAVIAFLTMDAAAYMTGQCLTVDGGLTLNSA